MLIYANRVNMEKSKFWERVRVAIVKFVTVLLISSCTANISAESEVYMITNNSSTLTYVKSSLNVSLATDSSLPYLHEG